MRAATRKLGNLLWICSLQLVTVHAWVNPWRSATVTARGFEDNRNTTMPMPNAVAARLGVKPLAQAPTWVWAWAWRGHAKLLPWLHMLDTTTTAESFYALQVLWCKALASCDRHSPTFDPEQWYMSVLPRSSRWILKAFWRLFPRLHHANIELRTTYLEQEIQTAIATTTRKNVRLITLGAGHDIRSARLLTKGMVQEAHELDLATVVHAKEQLLARLKQRKGDACKLPLLKAVDVNDTSALRKALHEIIGQGDDNGSWHTIFLSEGLFIYLNKGIPSLVLSECRAAVAGQSASFIFADRLDNVPGGEYELGRLELLRAGWKLDDWCPKPGFARHMGCASLIVEHG